MNAILLTTLLAFAQDDAADKPTGFAGNAAGTAPQVEIPWNRLYDYPELLAHFDRLVAKWPERMSMEIIGHSTGSREMRVYTLHNPATGPEASKPAMWVDGNVHGNEVQGGEAVLYMAAYLLENYDTNERVRELLDRSTFYLCPSVNPDGRASWFNDAHTASSSRSGTLPIDSDRDGAADEDGPDDLDGDGHITQMRKYVPGEGTHRLNPDDPRIMERVPVNELGIKGDWIMLGSEGIDNDGDGRKNEDGLGGYDMNRAWPSFWQPGHVQFGAGPYPLYWPETRCVGRFIYEHPNIAGVQSFHNSGGMILRGPGAQGFGSYPGRDLRVFDELGKDGEKMLPFYRYMIIWSDLYTVFGGFATWTYEGLGIISFTNELWTGNRNNPDSSRSTEGRLEFDDMLLMGNGYIPWHAAPEPHPLYGDIEIGGYKKDVGRVPPSFLIEEMLHRNAVFTLRHAESMPEVSIQSIEVSEVADGLKAVDVTFKNNRLIPTRTARAAGQKIGQPDAITLTGEGIEVLAGGFRSDDFRPERISLAEREPARLLSENGIGSRAELKVRWYVRGSGSAVVAWSGEKALDVSQAVEIE